MKDDKLVLEELNSGVSMGLHAIHSIYPQIENENLKEEIKHQREDYEKLEEKIKKISLENSETLKTDMETMMLKYMVKMKSMMNHDVSHLCKMLIEGSNKAVIEMTSLLNQYPCMSKEVKDLVEEFLDLAKKHIEVWKKYL